MYAADVFAFALRVLSSNRIRTTLILLAMGLGVTAVIVVSSLGEGARRYVLNRFNNIGVNLLIVLPGRAETTGNTPGFILGKTPRPLTIDDALALKRSPAIRRIAPLIIGSGDVHHGAKIRESPIMGTTAEMLKVRRMELSHGNFLPQGNPHHSQPVCIIGSGLQRELFGNKSALGQWLKIGDRRFRVIGQLAKQGQSMGFNSDELIIIPLASAQMLFNTDALFRVLVEAKSRDLIAKAKKDILSITAQRHEGERDITVITQDSIVSTFDRILTALTLTVGGLTSISLGVAGILIMNVMLVAVAQRKNEIGLIKALGATSTQIRIIFFTEAVLIALLGAGLGMLVATLGQWLLGILFPNVPFSAPWWAWVITPLVAIFTAILFAVAPAQRAARLNPVIALSKR